MIIDGTKRDENEKDGTMIGGGSQTLSASNSGNINPQRPTSSGRFTNLNTYINKNRGATNQTLNKARSDIDYAEANAANARNRIQGITDTGRYNYAGIRNTQNEQRRAAEDPYSMTSNVFSRNATANKDPIRELQNEQSRLGELSPSKESLSGLTSTGGIRNYLDSIRGNRPGSAGGRELDTFLLGATPESNYGLANISQRAANLNLDASSNINDLENSYNQVAGYDPNTALGQLTNRLESDLNVADEQSVANYNRLQQLLGRLNRATYTPPVVTQPQLIIPQIPVNTPSTNVPTLQPVIATPADVTRPLTAAPRPTTTQTTTTRSNSNTVPAGRPGQGRAPGGTSTMGGARPGQKRPSQNTGRRGAR